MGTLAALMTPAATTAARVRRVLALRGALLLAFGVVEGALVLLAFRVPHLTVLVLMLVMSGFLVLDGIVTALHAARAREPWLGRAPQALASLTAGVLILFVPYGRWLAVFVAWVIVSGVLDGVESLAAGSGPLVVSILSLALGVMLLASPVRDHAHLLLAVSAYSIVTGSLRLWTAGTAPRPPEHR